MAKGKGKDKEVEEVKVKVSDEVVDESVVDSEATAVEVEEVKEVLTKFTVKESEEGFMVVNKDGKRVSNVLSQKKAEVLANNMNRGR